MCIIVSHPEPMNVNRVCISTMLNRIFNIRPIIIIRVLLSLVLHCVPKSDAKIQIIITTAHLIGINYPLSSFNYRHSGTNVANFNKIHLMVSEQQLFKQVAQLSPRDRAAGWVSNGQKWKTGTERQYLRTI